MVYYKTNWIRDSNQWVIRKIRPVSGIFEILKIFQWWVIGLGGFLYFHFTIYEYLGRRVAFFNKWLDPRTETEKIEDAKKLKA